MTGQVCLLAVLSLMFLHSASSSTTADGLSPRYSTKQHPGTVDEVLMQANGERNLMKSRRLGHDRILDGLDMVLTEKQYAKLYGGPEGRLQGDDDEPLVHLWPNGVIPYQIDRGYFTPERLSKIREAITTWQNLTCVTFRPATSSDLSWVEIGGGNGCWSMLGKIKEQPQHLSLNYQGCFHRGTVEHELGHAIGLVHEHQRPERDYHLGVYENNVIPNFRDQLQAYRPGSVDKLGLDYDYYSLMHYGKTAFAFDGVSTTIFAYDRKMQKYLPKVTEQMGTVIGPSFTDVRLVNLMYNCNASCRPMPACGAQCFVDKHCRCICEKDMPAVPCANYKGDCEQWALQGECRANLPYMEYFCRKACKMCPEHGTLPPHEPHNQQACRDKRSDCQGLVDRGDCQTDREAMMMDCYKSCTNCSDTGTEHRETTTTAATTPTTPRTTPEPGTTTPQTQQPCEDKRSDCQALAARGDCETAHEPMLVECYRTCTGCSGSGTSNQGCADNDVNCAAWAEANYCDYYPHIIPTCKKSCGACS